MWVWLSTCWFWWFHHHLPLLLVILSLCLCVSVCLCVCVSVCLCVSVHLYVPYISVSVFLGEKWSGCGCHQCARHAGWGTTAEAAVAAEASAAEVGVEAGGGPCPAGWAVQHGCHCRRCVAAVAAAAVAVAKAGGAASGGLCWAFRTPPAGLCVPAAAGVANMLGDGGGGWRWPVLGVPHPVGWAVQHGCRYRWCAGCGSWATTAEAAAAVAAAAVGSKREREK